MSSTEGRPSPAREPGPAAPFFRACQTRLIDAGRDGPLVDLACGRGRNALAAAELGIPTVALDRNAGSLRELGDAAARRRLSIDCVRSDLETPHGIPLRSGSCAAALVFRFLHRPLCPHLEALLQPGGWLELGIVVPTVRTTLGTGRTPPLIRKPGLGKPGLDVDRGGAAPP